MAITPQQLQRLCQMANLQYDASILTEFNQLVSFVDGVNEQVPLQTPAQDNTVAFVALRKDELVPAKTPSSAALQEGYFTVQRVIK